MNQNQSMFHNLSLFPTSIVFDNEEKKIVFVRRSNFNFLLFIFYKLRTLPMTCIYFNVDMLDSDSTE